MKFFIFFLVPAATLLISTTTAQAENGGLRGRELFWARGTGGGGGGQGKQQQQQQQDGRQGVGGGGGQQQMDCGEVGGCQGTGGGSPGTGNQRQGGGGAGTGAARGKKDRMGGMLLLLDDDNNTLNKKENLTSTEESELQFMREEEKMARDIYQAFYNKYQLRIFQNIASSEQHHMDLVKAMLDIQEVEDPVIKNAVAGDFEHTEIQTLYDDLLETGEQNLTAALLMGGKIEEKDICDLKDAIEDTSKSSLDRLYQALMDASKNHLRAFARVLNNIGEGPYMSQYECVNHPYELEDILAGN